MNLIKDFLKIHQQKIALTIGYLLVAGLAFSVGHLNTSALIAPQVAAPEKFQTPGNYTANTTEIQSAISGSNVVTASNNTQNCDGKIKGTTSGIYHLPGGAFYDRVTKPIRCFGTEAQAIQAGFRKSTK